MPTSTRDEETCRDSHDQIRTRPPVDRQHAAATETAIGFVPTSDQLDLDGLDAAVSDIVAALAVDVEEWKAEIPLIDEWFDKIGDGLPTSMRDQLEALALRLGM